nr:EVE domain-containing protein [Candidatus Burkholderia verschuerenii]
MGARLVEEFKKRLNALQYISIEARVAEDMAASNVFWERQKFYVQRIAPGGKHRGKRGLMIAVRSHELGAPQLFGTSGITSTDPFGLAFSTAAEKPTFLLDLNVLFDIGPRRQRRGHVINLFRAERMDACNLAISSEILTELKRTCPQGKTDPIQDFVSILPTYAVPGNEEAERLLSDLAAKVFPTRSQLGSLTANDKSDLRHLVTAISHRLDGLVTSDSSILSAASELLSAYGLNVISPTAFSLDAFLPLDVFAIGSESDRILTISDVIDLDVSEIRELLSKLQVEKSQQLTQWATVDGPLSNCRRHLVRQNGEPIGYMTWHQPVSKSSISAMMAVDERSAGSVDCVRLMLSKLGEQTAKDQATLVRLGYPSSQFLVKKEAISLGFADNASAVSQLQKIVIKGLVTAENWQATQTSLILASGVRLPSEVPTFRNINQYIEIYTADGNRTHVPLLRLESMMAPALFCLPGRSGIITPVRRQFSEHLLQHLPQGSLLPQPRVQLYQQRHYLSHPKTLSKFTAGSLMFFYESQTHGGLGAIIAVGRVVRSYHQERTAMGHKELDPSVFEPNQLDVIGKTSAHTVTVFDNLNVLTTPVFGGTLREFGCGAPVKLLSTQTIDSEQVTSNKCDACRRPPDVNRQRREWQSSSLPCHIQPPEHRSVKP